MAKVLYLIPVSAIKGTIRKTLIGRVPNPLPYSVKVESGLKRVTFDRHGTFFHSAWEPRLADRGGVGDTSCVVYGWYLLSQKPEPKIKRYQHMQAGRERLWRALGSIEYAIPVTLGSSEAHNFSYPADQHNVVQ